jgi:hypothetical protein
MPTSSDEYQPGVCNIGPDEIRRRRLSGHVGAAMTAGVLSVMLAADAPRGMRLLAALPAAIAASGYLQARARFCAGYGQLGVFNFGPAGNTTEVADAAARQADRRKARKISVRSGLIGLGVGAAALLLP